MNELANAGTVVRDWLAREGYPFEFKVAEAFRSAGFAVYQGLYYQAESPEGRKARDIDVLAVHDRLVQEHPMTRGTILFAIECKSLPVPWVVFRGRSKEARWGASGALATTGIDEANLTAALDVDDDPWLLQLPADAGFRVAAAVKGNDHGYLAVQQAVAAARGVIEGEAGNSPTIAVPVVVLNAPLFAWSARPDGEGVLEPTKWERCLWRGEHRGGASIVDVIGTDGLGEYARRAAAAADQMQPILRGAALDRRSRELDAVKPTKLDSLLVAGEHIVEGTMAIGRRVRQVGRPDRPPRSD